MKGLIIDISRVRPMSSFIKGHRTQWLGHIVRRRDDQTLWIVMQWKPHGKRQCEDPEIDYIDGIEKELRALGEEKRKTIIQDIIKRDVVVVVSS